MKFASDARVFVALGAVDLRWGFDKLAALVVAHFGRDPRHGAFYVFLNRARTSSKTLFFDRSGFCVLHKRLDHGTFPLPVTLEPGAKQVAIGAEELHLLLGGVPGRVKRRTPRGPPLH
jgi:transposase